MDHAFLFFEGWTLRFTSVDRGNGGRHLILLLLKLLTKGMSVWPLCRAFNMTVRESNYTTLLMSTGLTLGTISAIEKELGKNAKYGGQAFSWRPSA